MNVFSRLAPLAAIAFVCTTSTIQAQVALRMKFTKGQSNTYEIVQDIKIAQTFLGKTHDSDVKQSFEYTQTVDDLLPGGGAVVSTKFNRVKITVNGPDGQMEFDSAANIANDGPAAEILAATVKMFAKIQCVAKQSSTGEITDLKLPDDFIQEAKTMPGGAATREAFTEQGIKQLLNQSTILLPKDPVKPGATWNQSLNLKLPLGKVSTDMKFTYQGTEKVGDKTMQKIAYIPKMTFAENDKDELSVKVLSQKSDGYYLFDNDQGRTQESAVNTVMEMSVNVMGQMIDQNLTMKASSKLKK